MPRLYGVDPEAINTHEGPARWVSSMFSMDSDLEAFSHNPTDVSVAALAVQPTALPNI